MHQTARPFLDERLNAVGTGAIWDVAADIVTAPVKAVAGAASDVTEAISDAVSSIPVLGDVTRIVGEAATAPLRLANSIASGARLDRAVMKSLKDQVRIAREAAPYAQTVVSLVPGVGTGVAAAVGAGTALAEGRDIDDIAKAAVRGAIPGGAVATAGFDAAVKIGQGKNVGKAALESAREIIPPGPGRQAFDVGLAVITGENIQKALVEGLAKMSVEQLGDVAEEWWKKASKVPALKKVLKELPRDGTSAGYSAAMGILNREGLNPKAVSVVRSKMKGKSREGFDRALKTKEKTIPWLKNVLSPPKEVAPPRAPQPVQVPKETAKPPTLKSKEPPKTKEPPTLKSKAPAKTPPTLKPVSTKTPPTLKTKAVAKPPTLKASPSAAISTSTYGPYPSGMLSEAPHGLGATSSAKRYFFWYVYKNGRFATSVGPQSLSDYEAFLTEERTKLSNFGAQLYRFVWQPGMTEWLYDARSPHELHAGLPLKTGSMLSAPPRHRGGGGRPPAHMARPVMRPFARGGGFNRWPGWWWDVPWQSQVVTRTETCRTWSDPVEMPPTMQTAARVALNVSKGQPTTVRGPDGVLYLFSIENGVQTARPCAAVAVNA